MAFLKINDVWVDMDKVTTISVKSEAYETNVMVNNVAVARCVNVTELDLERKKSRCSGNGGINRPQDKRVERLQWADRDDDADTTRKDDGRGIGRRET